mgnify:CR=1 FL=1
MDFYFFLNAIGFGIGLAMDAFSVSMANGLNEPKMKTGKAAGIAAVFHTIASAFEAFRPAIPWIALILLAFIGGKMLYEGIRSKGEEEKTAVGIGALFLQGIATSIDALSVGFTISDFTFLMALTECLVIGGVTFLLCFAGVFIGKKFGTGLAGKASILGGVILILIGLEIFLTGILG